MTAPDETRRRRSLRVLLAPVVAVVAIGLIAPAYAADPAQRKKQVDSQIDDVWLDLHNSSNALTQARWDYAAATRQLVPARAALATAQGQLVAAKARDDAMAAKVAEAVAKVADAEAKIAELTARMEKRRTDMGRLAAQAYQQSPLAEVAVVLDAESPAELTQRLSAVKSVLNAGGRIVDGLANDRAAVANERVTLRDLQAEAEKQRAEAAEALARTKTIEQQARSAKAEVDALVAQRESAFKAAEQERAADQRAYDQLLAERKRIEAELAARAQRARDQARRDSGGVVVSGSGYLQRPVGGYISSPYGWRTHPIYKTRRFHDGMDFGASCGTPIRAASAGEVVWAQRRGGYGNQVMVDHGGVRGVSLMTSYSHMSRFAVRSGQRVVRGQVIGYVGTTGVSTGCHLHFMVYVNGATTNPASWI